MIFSKKQKELALSLSRVDLLTEYLALEYNLKFYLFGANKKTYKKQRVNFRNYRKALLYQNAAAYSKKIERLSKNG